MGRKKKNPSWMDIPDLLEEIFILLPLKSILKFKTVSKQWRSILESKMFVERRMKVPKKRKILAAFNCYCGGRPSLLPESRSEGDEEIVYLHCYTTLPSISCDGLLCIPEPDYVTVLNPSTGQLRRFPYGPSPVTPQFINGEWTARAFTPVIGFGREKVTGSYQVVRMSIDIDPLRKGCHVLDVESGKWRKLRIPPYYALHVVGKSVCINGSIYWLYNGKGYKIVALDLHKNEFRNVSVPATWETLETQIVNLEGRLAIAKTKLGPEYMLDICCMKTEEESWSKTYSISLAGLAINPHEPTWFMPVAVSKQGNLVFYDNHRRLFKYYPLTDETRCLSSYTFVISPYLENLVPLRSKPGHHPDYRITTSRCELLFKKHPDQPGSRISKFWGGKKFEIAEIVSTSFLVVVVWFTIYYYFGPT